jgi:LacI family transcriptional regulator
MGKRATGDGPWRIRDVAAEAGVSTATVSRVLNNGVGFSAETRDRVLRAAERRGYRVAPTRRATGSRPGVVAVCCPYQLTDYFGLVLSGTAYSLQQRGKLVLLSTTGEGKTAASLYELLGGDRTEGAILIGPRSPTAALVDLRAMGYHFVVVEPLVPLPRDVAAISTAHMAGAKAATEHLIMLGHTRIATIGGPCHWKASRERLSGYRAALASIGTIPSDELVCSVEDPGVHEGLVATSSLLDLAEPPTAIVAFNDKTAIGAMEAAVARGQRVPEDLSVVGFDDLLEICEAVVPRLTTVRQRMEDMGRIAVEVLMRLLAGRDIDTLHVELATELVIGQSTGPPPARARARSAR